MDDPVLGVSQGMNDGRGLQRCDAEMELAFAAVRGCSLAVVRLAKAACFARLGH